VRNRAVSSPDLLQKRLKLIAVEEKVARGFDPDQPHPYFIESSAAQNAFFVLQDIPVLVALKGGAKTSQNSA
jgi:hypothetical protein